jgi:TonB-linked SusC/RagA family outer membrane protein
VKDVNERPIINTSEVLEGKAPGVQVVQPSGAPGADFSVRVRGIASPNGSEPLYVIDGVIAADTKSLDPHNIESISVLKDASAAGIYGAAGASNGVVLITTKKGVKGKSRSEINFYTGVQQITKKLSMLNSQQSAALIKEEYLNAGSSIDIPDSLVNNVNNNWQDLVYRNANQTGINAGFSGGSDKGTFYFGVGYTNQDGIIYQSNNTRYSLKLNLEQNMNKWLTVGTHIAYIRGNQMDVNYNASAQHGGVVLAALFTPPFIPIKTPGTDFYGTGLEGSYTPIKDIYAGNNKTIFNNLLGDIHAEIKLPYQLVFLSQLGISNENSNYDFFESPAATVADSSSGGAGNSAFSETFRYTWENTLSYSKTLDRHTFHAVIGTSAVNEKYTNNSESGNGYANGSIPTLNAATRSPNINYLSATQKTEWANISYFGRINYDYDNRYLFTASIRADGSSRFGTNNKWGYFPAFSAAWEISNEEFMKNSTFFQDLKIRAGWGATGNLPPVYYPSVDVLTTSSALLGTGIEPAYVPGNPKGNPDLKWESAKGINIGIDATILNSRVTITADYYNKKTTDMIFQQSLPATTGYGYTFINIPGVDLNEGFEFGITGKAVVSKDFNWTIGLNMGFNKNEISGLDSGSVYYTGGISFGGSGNNTELAIIKNGLPLGTFWGYIANGVDPQTGQMNYLKMSTGKYVDGLNVNPDSDRTSLGSGMPTLVYGFTNEFTYKNFSLYLLIDGVAGNKIFNATRVETEGMNTAGNGTTATLNRWRQAGDVTSMPQAIFGDPNSNTLPSTRFIESGAFTRLKSATLSYQLNTDFLHKMGLSGLRIFATATNLFTISNYSGYNPEVNAFGTSSTALSIDYGTYPQARTYSFGLNLQF